MACCGKKRRSQVSRITNQNFFKKSLKDVKFLSNVNILKLSSSDLLKYHKKCNTIYIGNIKQHPINKTFINSIVLLHDQIVNEMLKRKINHNTPLKKV